MSLLMKNEKEANLIVAKVMRVTFLIFTLIYLLNVIGVFVVDHVIMTIAYLGGSVLLLLPTLLVNIMKREGSYIKFVSVTCASVFVTLLSITLTYHVVAIYVYPIAIASLYFSKSLNIVATALTVVGVSVGQILAFYLDTIQDDNFTEFRGVIIFGIIPRALVLVAVAAIFTMLCSRTASMLSNLMGAEEQKEMFDRMKQMKDNAAQTSEVMIGMVAELSGSKEIIGIVQTITSISSQTNILALNASIEAARAGEHGKGFAVVAEEIQKLSEQTKTAVESIGSIVHEVVKNTEAAVTAMEQNAINTKNGMESIQKANESATLITSSNEELAEQVHAIDKVAEIIREKSGEVADNMKQISNNTQQNCNAVEQVSAATQENSAGAESLAEIVEQIKALSEQLNKVVQG